MRTIHTQIIETVKDGLNYRIGTEVSELHNALFNEDYFIIGRYQAEQFLKSTDEGIFGAIELIKDYENGNFGEVSTDFSEPETVVNMYAYIVGEEFLNSLDSIRDNWDEELTEELVNEILAEIEDNF